MLRNLAILFSGLLIASSGNAQATHPLFEPIAGVLQSPRCINCHTVTGFPRQGDENRRHDQFVVRGSDGFGAPTLQCQACHQDKNVSDGDVPGAPGWHLAPLSMGWEGLDKVSLCERLKDTSGNGGRSPADLVTHVIHDHLVLWGFEPGRRSTPPLTHTAFVDAMQDWADAGAPCQ